MLYRVWFRDGSAVIVDAATEKAARRKATQAAARNWLDAPMKTPDDLNAYALATTTAKVDPMGNPEA